MGVRRWLSEPPTAFGFATDLWTAPRLAAVMEREWGVGFHPNYLAAWLRARGFAPQLPRRRPRERDQAAVDQWLAEDWPRIKKRPGGAGRPSSLWTKAGC